MTKFSEVSPAHLVSAIPTTDVAYFIEDLARRCNVTYVPTAMDSWADTVTCLSGDEVQSGHVQDLLIALRRAGKLSTNEMMSLLVNYLRECQKHR